MYSHGQKRRRHGKQIRPMCQWIKIHFKSSFKGSNLTVLLHSYRECTISSEFKSGVGDRQTVVQQAFFHWVFFLTFKLLSIFAPVTQKVLITKLLTVNKHVQHCSFITNNILTVINIVARKHWDTRAAGVSNVNK